MKFVLSGDGGDTLSITTLALKICIVKKSREKISTK